MLRPLLVLTSLVLLPFLAIPELTAAPFKIGLVLDKGGKDDKSFNAAAFEGMQRAQKELGVEGKFVEASDDNSFEPLLRSFAKKDFDLIIAVGFAQAEAVRKIAPQFPQKKFALVDSIVDLPNVRSLMFEEQEGSYLVGALAAMKSKTGKIGFVGGMDIPLIQRFLLGYEAGAKAVNPKISVSTSFVGISGDAWNNPAKAKELALAQYQSGFDVIYTAAGASNKGVFDAAEDRKALAVGCDSNQNGLKPGRILTSMLKRVDVAVFSTIQDTKDGKFTAGTQRYGLANKGVDLAMDSHNAGLIDKVQLAKLEQIKADIVAKKIAVPDAYLVKKK
jgi:basic membrane protein A